VQVRCHAGTVSRCTGKSVHVRDEGSAKTKIKKISSRYYPVQRYVSCPSQKAVATAVVTAKSFRRQR